MSSVGDLITVGAYAIGLLGIGGGVFSFLRFDDYKTTVKLQNDSIAALKTNNQILADQVQVAKDAHTETLKAMSKIEGKLESYKEIPLREISQSLSELAESNKDIKESNKKILDTLQGNPEPEADGGLLVKTAPDRPVSVEVKK